MSFTSAEFCTPGSCTDDAVEALALHDGLGYAELVDAVAQRGDVGGDGEVAALAHLLRGHHAIDRRASGDVSVAAGEIGLRLLHGGAHRGAIRARGQQHAQAIRDVRIDRERADVGEGDLLGAEHAAEILVVAC